MGMMLISSFSFASFPFALCSNLRGHYAFVHLHCVHGLKLYVFLSCNEFYTYAQQLFKMVQYIKFGFFFMNECFLFQKLIHVPKSLRKMLHWERIPFFYHDQILLIFQETMTINHQITEIVMERHMGVERQEFSCRSKRKVLHALKHKTKATISFDSNFHIFKQVTQEINTTSVANNTEE